MVVVSFSERVPSRHGLRGGGPAGRVLAAHDALPHGTRFEQGAVLVVGGRLPVGGEPFPGRPRGGEVASGRPSRTGVVWSRSSSSVSWVTANLCPTVKQSLNG
jgi:hypothetical protein